MGDVKRPSSWSYNPQLSTSKQVNLCSRSYNDDYSRGHLIPNASRNARREAQEQTFYVTNSVPQIQNGFNGGVWMHLESAVQQYAEHEPLYITAGVVFEPVGESCDIAYTSAKDDTKRVPVPNYFYKVVLKVKSDAQGNITDASTVGLWFEHRTYSDSFENYTVSVNQIEEWTGFDYFPSLDDELEARAEKNSSWKVFKAW
jgi:endonuclease G